MRSIAEFARLCAVLEDPFVDRVAALAAAGLNNNEWAVARDRWLAQLDAEATQGRRELAEQYAEVYASVRQPPSSGPSSPASAVLRDSVAKDAGGVPTSVPTLEELKTPGKLPSYLLSQQPSEVRATEPVAPPPIVVRNAPAARAEIDATAELRALREEEPAVPFGRDRSPEFEAALAAPRELKSRAAPRGLGDETAALPALRDRDPSTPFLKSIPAVAAAATAVKPPPPKPPSDGSETAQHPAIPEAPSLPFGNERSPSFEHELAAPKPARPRDLGSETAALPSLRATEGHTPFVESTPGPRLALAQYASLCAQLAVAPEQRAALIQRFGLVDETGKKREDQAWSLTFQKSAEVQGRFNEAYVQLRQKLEAQRGPR